MDQYAPAWKVTASRHNEIDRRITRHEYDEARRFAREVGLWRLDERRPVWSHLVH
jgi:uncharacterized Fe-S radical SAM superfamily protein PflX